MLINLASKGYVTGSFTLAFYISFDDYYTRTVFQFFYGNTSLDIRLKKRLGKFEVWVDIESVLQGYTSFMIEDDPPWVFTTFMLDYDSGAFLVYFQNELQEIFTATGANSFISSKIEYIKIGRKEGQTGFMGRIACLQLYDIRLQPLTMETIWWRARNTCPHHCFSSSMRYNGKCF